MQKAAEQSDKYQLKSSRSVSDQSIIVRMKQQNQYKILKNRLFLGIALNIIMILGLITTISDFCWYNFSSASSHARIVIDYGLVYYHNRTGGANEFHLSSLENDQYQIAGLTSFFIFFTGFLLQLAMVAQYIIFYQQFKMQDYQLKKRFNKKCLKFKMLRRFVIFFYIFGGLYWITLINLTTYHNTFSIENLGRDFYIGLGLLVLYIIIFIYVGQLKKSIKD